ncbi:uncharacterized protein N7529_007163 [Penicillium soppii]|uniref:uncharacterized protein n=1 Tax=Penicillium soppii TaxID=69789 RepID=UPI0025472614|nr:uncharacterized protein N7529_007163 [Penicillium soppii]KAJ5865247.1 hypothetical protein N7529_007163 [Penicillium soppii]
MGLASPAAGGGYRCPTYEVRRPRSSAPMCRHVSVTETGWLAQNFSFASRLRCQIALQPVFAIAAAFALVVTGCSVLNDRLGEERGRVCHRLAR